MMGAAEPAKVLLELGASVPDAGTVAVWKESVFDNGPNHAAVITMLEGRCGV